MLPLFGAIVSAISGVASGWLETRKVKAQGRIDIAKAKVELKVSTLKMKSQMDLESMKGMQFSWKDEYILVLMSIPVIMCFIPDFTIAESLWQPAATALKGFSILKQTPEWFRWGLTGIIAATFGLRTWTNFKK